MSIGTQGEKRRYRLYEISAAIQGTMPKTKSTEFCLTEYRLKYYTGRDYTGRDFNEARLGLAPLDARPIQQVGFFFSGYPISK